MEAGCIKWKKNYSSATSGSASQPRSAGVVDGNLVSPVGVSFGRQYPAGQKFYTDGIGGFWTVTPEGDMIPLEVYDLPRNCSLLPLSELGNEGEQKVVKEEVPMPHLPVGRKPPFTSSTTLSSTWFWRHGLYWRRARAPSARDFDNEALASKASRTTSGPWTRPVLSKASYLGKVEWKLKPFYPISGG